MGGGRRQVERGSWSDRTMLAALKTNWSEVDRPQSLFDSYLKKIAMSIFLVLSLNSVIICSAPRCSGTFLVNWFIATINDSPNISQHCLTAGRSKAEYNAI